MYLQITTKCNMSCDHCGFACTKYGRHMKEDIWRRALHFMNKIGEEHVSIGGGEPTLHPQFFDIIYQAIEAYDFFSVWMATNGSQTETMKRLYHILHDEDWLYQLENMDCDCGCDEEEIGEYGCLCHEKLDRAINGSKKLVVELSLDAWHDPIDPYIEELWKRLPESIRNVGKYGIPFAQGRAKSWGRPGCSVPGEVIKPSGKIYPCGCKGSPQIGDIFSGYYAGAEKWRERAADSGCYRGEKLYV